MPPMNYMVQVTDKGNQQYFGMENNFQSLRDITEAVEVNMDELHQKYETIRSEENREYMDQILQNYISAPATAAVAQEEVSLTVEANQSMFVPVQDGSGYSYGGNHEYEWHWMTITKYYRDTTDSRWIAVSTWGQRRSINYRTHFDAIAGNRTLGGGFMYFK
ncbi:hypothetical protein [Paenibacillus sp.]|uniref:hypothetical protein n=1 Tax=Paenibacillus sp. TaxID=58172 RepID=UPI000BC84D9A|nr:hypothetical protein [Paenibacillus sp.]OZQ66875.1 hypothetical protein CA599_18045 [Paenibacillus taichungensis]